MSADMRSDGMRINILKKKANAKPNAKTGDEHDMRGLTNVSDTMMSRTPNPEDTTALRGLRTRSTQRFLAYTYLVTGLLCYAG
eukprot:870358-Pleurochrysis_carterae.AAC.1